MQNLSRLRRTKIVCTLGPATASHEKIKELILAGMDVVRLNFSHGDHESHSKTVDMIRSASREVGKEVGILQDLGGPKIRLGNLKQKEIKLKPQDKVILRSGQDSSDDAIPVNYKYLLEDVKENDRILLADGLVELLVNKIQDNDIICEVIVGGLIHSHKGVNLPSSDLRISAFTEKDQKDLMIGLKENVDFVALSFVRHEKDLEQIRQILSDHEDPPLLIAKIEKPQAVERLANILELVDGVMVARGDLGVEMPLEEVPIIQKKIIRMASEAGKPVITATQMLRSMVDSPRPTRAEATDVANAVLDRTDAVMLSEETAIGSFPIESVKTLDKIARATEPHIEDQSLLKKAISPLLPSKEGAISRSACWLAQDLGASAIAASTTSGRTARLVASFRPHCPIIGLTTLKRTLRQLTLTWGVIPAMVEVFDHTDKMFQGVRSWVLENKIAEKGDCVIITAGVPLNIKGTTNLLKMLEIK